MTFPLPSPRFPQSFPCLRTSRLHLRRITPDDTAGLYRIRNDYQVTRLNTGAAFTAPYQARDLAVHIGRMFDTQREIWWGLTLPPDDTVFGMCILYALDNPDDRRATLGYEMAQAYWGRGLMREAVGATLAWGFDQHGLHRVEADADRENHASIRLLRGLGFQDEGVQRERHRVEGAYHDLLLFGLLKREWEAGRR